VQRAPPRAMSMARAPSAIAVSVRSILRHHIATRMRLCGDNGSSRRARLPFGSIDRGARARQRALDMTGRFRLDRVLDPHQPLPSDVAEFYIA